MRQLLKTLEVHKTIHNHTDIITLTVEEWHECLYGYEQGYLCSQDDDEYFVAVTGIVEKRDCDGWYEWGVCPVLENEYKLFEQLLDIPDSI